MRANPPDAVPAAKQMQIRSIADRRFVELSDVADRAHEALRDCLSGMPYRAANEIGR